VTRPVTRMGNRIRRTTRQIGGGLQRLNAKLRATGKIATSAFGVAGIAGAMLVAQQAIGAVVMKGAELEQTLVGAAARFGEGITKNTERFQELEDLARQIGATTEFTANEAAGGLNFLAKAGFNAAQSMELLPGLVDLATASELDLARASDIASDAIGAFGLQVDDAAQLGVNFRRVSDAMAKTVNSANTDMEQLFETIKTGAPAATAAGTSMETFLALTGQLAGAGVKASQAGTILKNIFTKLADEKVQRQLKQMGISVTDNSGNLRDFADILEEIDTKSAGGLKRLTQFNELFGLRGVTGVAVLAGQGADKLREFRGELLRSEGETARLAKQLRDTRQGQLKTLNSAVESLTLSFSKANDSGIGSMIGGLTNAVRAMDAFIQRNPDMARLVATLLLLVGVGLAIAAIFTGVAAAVGFVASSTAALIALGVTAALTFANWVANLEVVKGTLDEIFLSFSRFGEGSGVIDRVYRFGRSLFGAEEASGMEGPDARTQRSIEESRQSSTATLTIKDESGRAELKDAGQAPGIGLVLEPSGAL
jgi:TP901 family phage tail tape measure protein